MNICTTNHHLKIIQLSLIFLWEMVLNVMFEKLSPDWSESINQNDFLPSAEKYPVGL